MEPIRVLVADDNVLLRSAIRSLLEKFPNIEVAGESGAGGRVFSAIKSHQPDVVLVEIGSAGLTGVATIAKIASQFPGIGIVVLSSYAIEEFVVEVLRAGARGYLLRWSTTKELVTAIKAASEGRVYTTPAITRRSRGEVLDDLLTKKSPFQKLTRRQREILRLIAEGRNTKEIAILTELSAKTVAFHRIQLMKRLNIDNVPGLVRYAIRIGMVTP